MIQNWKKTGFFNLQPLTPDKQEYFSVPFAVFLRDDVFRVYYSPRDSKNRSFVSYADIDLLTMKVLTISERPVLTSGDLGSFDDSGVVLFQILNAGDKEYLYYSGWMLGVTVPFYFWIGLAISNGNGEFVRYSKAPILPCHEYDPFLTGAPYVLYDSQVWKMWYISGTKWEIELNNPKHFYTLKYAESDDGINWTRNENICLPYKNSFEYAIARPCVIKENSIYKMWFSYRGSENAASYRIGYAESNDGLNWQRLDELVGLDVSENGWDSEMICYGHVFNHNKKRYMLYNGNGYGKSGIGLAVLENY